jgi:hypothetical protein
MWVLRGATVLVGYGLYEFETSMTDINLKWILFSDYLIDDVGLTGAVAKIWKS